MLLVTADPLTIDGHEIYYSEAMVVKVVILYARSPALGFSRVSPPIVNKKMTFLVVSLYCASMGVAVALLQVSPLESS